MLHCTQQILRHSYKKKYTFCILRVLIQKGVWRNCVVISVVDGNQWIQAGPLMGPKHRNSTPPSNELSWIRH